MKTCFMAISQIPSSTAGPGLPWYSAVNSVLCCATVAKVHTHINWLSLEHVGLTGLVKDMLVIAL